MAFANGKMQPNKTATAQARMKTAGPNGSFPIGDAKHARLAILGATRSERVGHISSSTEASIKAKARSVLSKGPAMANVKVTNARVKAGEAMKSQDTKQDKAGEKRTGLSHAAFERTAGDRKADAARATHGRCPTCGKPR